ncbi:unnamed protein product [Moneuplotes crassus]|uniref:Uncharacterized protein n=1 Tax=Euplotes crassus TaxID=5936 RepID=A0AAD1UJ18_EUPCR|nr:unnamed protein product [Moneuplotes crassus]
MNKFQEKNGGMTKSADLGFRKQMSFTNSYFYNSKPHFCGRVTEENLDRSLHLEKQDVKKQGRKKVTGAAIGNESYGPLHNQKKYGYKHDLSKKSDTTKEILSGSKLPTKKHFGGNFKNFPTKNHIYAHSQKKTFTSSQVKSIPVSTTANFLGTSSCQDVDVLQGFHKKKVKYRPIQAKDAINYKSWVEKPKQDFSQTQVISKPQLEVYQETKDAYRRNKYFQSRGVFNSLW